MTQASKPDRKGLLEQWSGQSLQAALDECESAHAGAVEYNKRLRDEIQHTQNIAAVVVSILFAVYGSAQNSTYSGFSNGLLIVATVLLALTVLGSLMFLFNTPPGYRLRLQEHLADQATAASQDALRRLQLLHLMDAIDAGSLLLKRRILQSNLIKAALANAILFIGAALLFRLLP